MNKQYSFIDSTGQEIIPFSNTYEAREIFNELGLAIVEEKRPYRYGVIDKKGNTINKTTYDFVSGFDKGYVIARKNALLGLIDQAGEQVVPFEYTLIKPITENHILVYGSNQCKTVQSYGFLDGNGEAILPCEYDKVQFFTDPPNIARLVKDNKYGFYSLDGKYKIPAIYEAASILPRDGLVAVKINGKWDFVDHENNTKIPFVYDEVTDFKKGFAYVTRSGFSYFINKNNELVPAPKPSFWLGN